VIDFVTQLFPIEGDRFRLELGGDEPQVAKVDGNLVATVRLIVFDEDGSPRDIKEQTLHLLPARHQDERGRAFLSVSVARARNLGPDDVELMMPSDLFRSELLDAPISVDAFARVLDDERAVTILDRRPRDARLLATLDPETRNIPTLCNPELEAVIRERVDDPGAYEVYGDWLSERGDPRGELIALQIAGKDASALLDEYAWEWLGALAWLDEDVRVDWRYGFPVAITIGSADYRSDYADVASLVRAIARMPNMASVETIDIKPTNGWHSGVFAAIGEGLPRSTRRLAIQTPEHERMDDLPDAYSGMQSIAELRLESYAFELGTIALPNLRALDLVTRGLTKENLESLREAQWPALERLVLWISDEGVDECDVEIDDLAWILAGATLPALKHLGLCGRADGQPLFERLLEAPILPQLEVLDLAGTYLPTDVLATFRAQYAKLAHLRAIHLDTRDHRIDLPNIVDDQRFIPVYE
jgi:uncharacterized protein (TIGR02996 family)